MQINKISPIAYNSKLRGSTISNKKENNSVSFGTYKLVDIFDIEDKNFRKAIQNKFLPQTKKFDHTYYFKLQNNAGYQATAEKIVDKDEEIYIKGIPVNNRMSTDSDSTKIIKQMVLNNRGELSKNTSCFKDNTVESWVYRGNKSTYTITKGIDDKKHTYTEIELQVEIFNSESGEPEFIIATKPSKKLNGAFETTKYILADYPEDMDIIKEIKEGTITGGEKLSSVTQNSDGSIVYNENYTYDGKEITKRYVKADGRNSYSYEIKNENGTNLFKLDRSFQKNEDGTTTTIINDKEYKVEFIDDEFEAKITMPNGKSETICLSDKCGLMDLAKFYEFIKYTPADFILSLKDIDRVTISNIISAFDSQENKLYGPTNLPTLTHEIGHSIDLPKYDDWFRSGELSGDKGLIDIYNKEMEKFQKENPMATKDILNYFSQIGGGSSAISTGLTELIADAHTLMFVYGHVDDSIQLRINYLSKYFPETVAKVGTMLGYNQVKN